MEKKTIKENEGKPKHRMYCGKNGFRCLVDHLGEICPDIKYCEACNYEQTNAQKD